MKALLLNNSYQPLAFISERKAIKLILKDKAEVISYWNKKWTWGSGSMAYPAVMRLNYYVQYTPRRCKFNRIGVFRRDRLKCQYCGKNFPISKLTIDHIMPASRGGKSDYSNCVACCHACNLKKGNRTPEEAAMPLLIKPFVPSVNLENELYLIHPHHPDWKTFLNFQ